MDQEQLAPGHAAIRGHPNEAVAAALVTCRRDDDEAPSQDVKAQGLPDLNDFVLEVTAAAAGTAAVAAGARSEDQRPRQGSGHSGRPSGGRVRTGATTASAAAARVRLHEQARHAPTSRFEGCSIDDDDVKAEDFREFDEFIKMHLQRRYTLQLLTRLQQPPSPSSAEGGDGEVAPAPASPDLELRL